MSETTTRPPPSDPGMNIFLHPGEVLINLIVTYLAPMFLFASGGDITYARMAAAETVASYRAQTEADLIAVAQIIAFGLAALGSLSLSMEDNLSTSAILRLRGNANACNRSAQQNRRALREARPDNTQTPAAPPEPVPEPEFDEAEVIAAVAATRQRAADNLTSPKRPPQAPGTAPQTAAASTLMAAEEQYQAIWAASAAKVAAEMMAEIASLPPAERQGTIINAAALKDCANGLLAGNPLPPRPRPGDLGRN